nr:ribonuclease H-like domain-containing protein [Tanacetum cinerariifolium]
MNKMRPSPWMVKAAGGGGEGVVADDGVGGVVEGVEMEKFTRDNNCTIEFDASGISVKDFLTRHILIRCDSSGDLYPVTKPSTLSAAFVSTSSTTLHQRLDYPGDEVLRSLSSHKFISCNIAKSIHVCHACKLGC